MRRKRPKQFIHDPPQHARLRRKWRSWLPSMSRGLSHLLGSREIFSELQEIAQDNPSIFQPSSFFDWMCKNYVSAATISVRGFVDMRSDVRSLGRMLYEILEHPGVISRSAHLALYRNMQKHLLLDIANASFDGLVGDNCIVLPQAHIRKDIRLMENATERVVKFTHKRVAHRAPIGDLRKVPQFNELNSAMDALDKLFCKYNCLLTASGLSSAFATRQYNWKEVLYEPWVKPGSRFRPDAYSPARPGL
jgi:hypothetical protein